MSSQQQNSQECRCFLTESQLRSIAIESAQHLGWPTHKDAQLEAMLREKTVLLLCQLDMENPQYIMFFHVYLIQLKV